MDKIQTAQTNSKPVETYYLVFIVRDFLQPSSHTLFFSSRLANTMTPIVLQPLT